MSRRIATVVVLLLFLAPALPSAGQTAPDDGARLRLYGCGDDLDVSGPATTIGPDGLIDCAGDRVRFPAAWLSGASDPALRAVLPTHDQRVDLTVLYHPTYWAPAPGTAADPRHEVALPGDATAGLFDAASSGTAGRLDHSYFSDEAFQPSLDDDDVPDHIDLAPHDGLVDRHDRSDGRDIHADLYFPALETRHDLTWFRDSVDPVALPDGASLLFPGVTPVAGVTNHDAWGRESAPPRTHWFGRPMGLGDGSDGVGALVTAPVTLRQGETARFLDHSIRVAGFVNNEGRQEVSLDVRFDGRSTPSVIGAAIRLDLDADGQRPATIRDPGAEPRNLIFADGRTVTRSLGPTSDDGGHIWFAVLSAIDDPADPREVTVRLGRLVSAAAPLNMVLVDGGAYRVSELREQAGNLRMFSWTRILPLDEDFRFRSIGVDIASVKAGARLPLLAPFDREHVHLEDMRPEIQRDKYGFLRERTGGNGVVGTGELVLGPGAATPGDRARRADPVDLRWSGLATESRLAPMLVQPDGGAARSLVAPFRYVSLQVDRVVLMHSALLDDEDLVAGATSAPNSPRAARSFIFDLNDPFVPYLDKGLHLYSGTVGDANAADVLRLGTAIIRPAEHTGLTRIPSALAAQRIDLDVRHQAYHVYQDVGRGLGLVSDEWIDRNIDADDDPHIVDARRAGLGDNLYDVTPRNDDPALGNIYGPALEVRYTGRLIDPGTYLPIDVPFDAKTRIYLPAADRDSGRPGLDSLDLNGDGAREGIAVAGYWDRDGTGPVGKHWKTSEGFDSARDLVWLQSPLLEVPIGGEGRFFDHGVHYVSYEDGTGTFRVSDLQGARNGTEPPVVVEVPNVGASDARCLSVKRGGSGPAVGLDCAERQAADLAPPYEVRPQDDKWWVEVVEVGAASASVRMSRVVEPAGDARPMYVGGVSYRWHDWTPGTATGVGAWGFQALVPLGADVKIAGEVASTVLTGLSLGGRLPLLPPFDGRHLSMEEIGIEATRDMYGFEEDAALRPAADRLRWVGPLFVQVEQRDQASAHRFIHLDPTRWMDPGRAPGHAFVGATFATPWHGIIATDPWLTPFPDRLKVSGPDGFDEALQGSGDRGWDQFVRLDLPFGHAPYRLDAARLGAPAQTIAPERQDPWTAGRTSAYFMVDPSHMVDPFVMARHGAVQIPPVVETPPGPVALPEDDPPPGGENEDGPAPGIIVALAALALVAAALRRRRH